MLQLTNNFISTLTPFLLMLLGLFFSFKLKFFYLRHPIKMAKAMLKAENKGAISPFRAVTLALAGTLGVGNIAGVASSIAIGGFGSVFWMWLSAILAMVLKYSEIVLAIRHRRIDTESGTFRGGASYYIQDHFKSRGFGIIGRCLGVFFAILCVINSITMGCVIQANAAASSLEGVVSIPPKITGLIISILCIVVISGNAKWISGISEKTVPFMTLGYVLLSVAVLATKGELIGEAFQLIFKDAFSFRSISGGIFGFLLSKGLKAGVMRGLMSNEAGCGTAPTAHASAEVSSASKQGFWGIFEVFVDTILLCTLTALVIIVAHLNGFDILQFSANPMMMAIKAYSSILGVWSEYFMAGAVLLFAFATLTCWAHYGKESLIYITKNKALSAVYVILFSLFVFIGSLTAPDFAWLLADLALGVMTLINLAVLFLMRQEIKEETDSFFKYNKKPKIVGKRIDSIKNIP